MTRPGYTAKDLDDPRFQELASTFAKLCGADVQVLRSSRRTNTSGRLHIEVGDTLVPLGSWDLPVTEQAWKRLPEAAADALLGAGVKMRKPERPAPSTTPATTTPGASAPMRQVVHPDALRVANGRAARLAEARRPSAVDNVDQLELEVGAKVRDWMRRTGAVAVRWDERGRLTAEFASRAR